MTIRTGSWARWVAFATVAACSGCYESHELADAVADGGTTMVRDAGAASDIGVRDGGTRDAGDGVDGGVDSGEDAGRDSGPPDASDVDAATDLGVIDGGMPPPCTLAWHLTFRRADAPYAFVVPVGCGSLHVVAWGGGGGGGQGVGGGGAYVQKEVPATPGDVWTVRVASGGFGAEISYGEGYSGGGGGASIVSAATVLVVAGGGGGGGTSGCGTDCIGGYGNGGGGGLDGQPGAPAPTCGSGAPPSAGGEGGGHDALSGRGGTGTEDGHAGGPFMGGSSSGWMGYGTAHGGDHENGGASMAADGSGGAGGSGVFGGGGGGYTQTYCGAGGGGGSSMAVGMPGGMILSAAAPNVAGTRDPAYEPGIGVGGLPLHPGGDGLVVIFDGP